MNSVNSDDTPAAEASISPPEPDAPPGAGFARDLAAVTRFAVGLEQGSDEGVLVHSFSVPGCVAAGPDRDAALESFGAELASWLAFLGSVAEPVPDPGRELDIVVEEWISTDEALAGGGGSVLFETDLAPLEPEEIQLVLHRLGDLRGPLLRAIRQAGEPGLDRAGESGWTARHVCEELARAQWWTLTRLGASPLAEVPGRTLGRLDTAMALVVQQLTTPTPEPIPALELEGELWSPRKVARRLLWLEWTLGGTALSILGGDSHTT
jgi:hypothetical protein